MTTSAGFLPIHYAACRKNVDAIELLANLYPESVIGKTKYGKTPLYYTARNVRNYRHPTVSRSDIVKLLVRSYRGALFTTLEEGISNLEDIQSLMVEWSCQALKRSVQLHLKRSNYSG